MDVDISTQTAIVGLIVGFLAPLLTAVFNKTTWSSQTKQLVALGVAVALALIAMLVTGGFTGGKDILVILTAVVGISQAAYTLIWKPDQLGAVAPKIEAATSSPVAVLPDDGPKHAVDGE